MTKERPTLRECFEIAIKVGDGLRPISASLDPELPSALAAEHGVELARMFFAVCFDSAELQQGAPEGARQELRELERIMKDSLPFQRTLPDAFHYFAISGMSEVGRIGLAVLNAASQHRNPSAPPLRVIFEMSGGCFDGTTVLSDSENLDEAGQAQGWYWVSKQGQVGACFMATPEFAINFLREHGPEKTARAGLTWHRYRVTDRLDGDTEVLIRAAHFPVPEGESPFSSDKQE